MTKISGRLVRIGFCDAKGRTVVVPQHKPLKPGTLKGVLEQAAVSLEQFVEQL